MLSVFLPILALGVLGACSRKSEPPAGATSENPPVATATAAPDQKQQAERAPYPNNDRWSRDEPGTRAAAPAPRERTERRESTSTSMQAEAGASRRELPRAGRTSIPAGTLLKVRITSPVSTQDAHTGDLVTSELATPVEVDGRDVLPAGTRVNGQVIAATTSGRMSRPASIEFAMTTLVLQNGEEVPIETSHFTRIGKGHTERNAGLIAGGAAVGALVGQLAGKDTDSTLKGAAAGAAAGTGAAAATGQLDFTIQPGEMITFKLEAPAHL